MITPAYAQTMAAYNAEMNRRLYGAADRMTEADRRAERGAFWGSIHGTFSHLLWADRMWMSRFDGWEKPPVPLQQSAAWMEDYAALKSARLETDAKLQDWAGRLTPEWLQRDLIWYSGATQQERSATRALLVTHLFNHQTHHRGQAHALLTAAGEQTGDTDLPWVLPAI